MTSLEKQTENRNSRAMFLIFLGWLMYMVSYFGKVNYSANITQIIDFYGVTKAQAGVVPTFFFFAYGAGQVINGLFCKKYNIKWMIFSSLFVSGIINLIIAITTNFIIIKWLWLVNGLALSVLWPTIIRLLSESLPQKKLGTSSVIMGTTVAVGTLIIYGLSSVFAAFDKFKLSFYTAGLAVVFVSFIWLVFYKKAVNGSRNEKEAEERENAQETVEKIKSETKETSKQDKNERKLFVASIYILCFFAIGVNLIKDGLVTWVPSILKEEFSMSDSISILLTLLLPVVAIFGNAFALSIHKKIPDFVNHCSAVFAVIIVFIGIIIGSLVFDLVIFMLIGLVIANFLAYSLNSLLTSIFPLFMRGKVNSGLFAGILNGFCYLGSTISSYGLGVVADNFGWSAVFYTLAGFCVFAIDVWIGYYIAKHVLNKNTD